MKNRELSKFLIKFSIGLSAVALVFSFNYVIDPLQFYRLSTLTNPELYNEERYQNPALARNYDYNSVILGSSLTQNFSPAYANKLLGYKTLKLSTSGATIYEQRELLDLAFRKKDISNVIWCTDYSSLIGSPSAVKESGGEYPSYLYDNNPINDFKYIINYNTFELSIYAIQRTFLKDAPKLDAQLETYHRWGKNNNEFGKEKALKKYSAICTYKLKDNKLGGYSWDAVKNNIDLNVISVVKAHPETNFKLFFPPYSVLAHKYYSYINPNILDIEMHAKLYLATELDSCKNVQIYDFQGIKDIILNLDNYRDTTHYKPYVNSFMLDCMKNGKYLVKLDGYEEELTKFKELIRSYTPEKLVTK